MVKRSPQDSEETRTPQASEQDNREPNKIGAATPFDFSGKNLTPYGGLLPVATMLEKLGFQQLVEETLAVYRIPRVMTIYQFLSGMVLALYVGFSRLNHLRFVAHDAMLTGILKVAELPPQCTFRRFLASLHLGVARQLLVVQQRMRERVWEAAHVKLSSITLDTDTTVHTLYGRQMGGRKSYNPKNKGKKSNQPILTFLAETREYIWGELRNGDRPTGQQIAHHLQGVFAALPPCIVKIFARADAGFYCWEAVQAYEKGQASFVIVARKTKRLLAELQSARWQPSPRTDADEQCELCYQPEGWGKPYRFIALRYQKQDPLSQEREQYQLFDSPQYIYRVFVTDMKRPIDLLVWFYNQRAEAENLIKEANNDAVWRPILPDAGPPTAFIFNWLCWPTTTSIAGSCCSSARKRRHTTLAIARLRFLFLAAKIWRHAGRVGINYSDQYAERGLFQRLMDRLRNIAPAESDFKPVFLTPLRS